MNKVAIIVGIILAFLGSDNTARWAGVIILYMGILDFYKEI